MNFFDQQNYHKKQTIRLRVLFFIVVVTYVIAMDAFILLLFPLLVNVKLFAVSFELVLITSLIPFTILFLCGFYKYKSLNSDLSVLARRCGAVMVHPRTKDMRYKRLINLVEEMSIASGIPAPQIYLLNKENAINAFALGINKSTAGLVVTRGALEKLNRDELQGLVSHEFSHIQNSDIKLNVRLISFVHGLLFISQLGIGLMSILPKKKGYKGGGMEILALFIMMSPLLYLNYLFKTNNPEAVMHFGIAQVWMIGFFIFVYGWLGLFLSRIVKSYINKQREYLADAAATEFTRQTSGLTNTLAKVIADDCHSYLESNNTEEISHMLLATGLEKYHGFFDTHPPLLDRITKLDSEFAFDKKVIKEKIRLSEVDVLQEKIKGNMKKIQEAKEGEKKLENMFGSLDVIIPEALTESIANPVIEHVLYAEQLYSSLPTVLIDAAHDQDDAVIDLVIALHMHNDVEISNKQMQQLNLLLGKDRVLVIKHLCSELLVIGDKARLPLLEIAFPALKLKNKQSINFMFEVLERIVEFDIPTEPFVYALSRVLKCYVRDANLIERQAKIRSTSDDYQDALNTLFGVVSFEGSHDTIANSDAYKKGIQYLVDFDFAKYFKVQLSFADVMDYAEPDKHWIPLMDKALMVLDSIDLNAKKILIEALLITLAHDKKLSLIEAELFRAICMSLHCPVPPLGMVH